MSAKFGPAGTGDDFKAKGHKSSLQVPKYLAEMGLDCFEYQCGRGVNIGEEKARELGDAAKQHRLVASRAILYFNVVRRRGKTT